MIKFQFCPIAEWPPLAWVAHCSEINDVVTVYHGNRVETRNAWFCEAVWDEDFEAADFDLTDLVFGSGGRAREDKLTFVSSGTTVDRLQSLTLADGVWVSNSLACLLTVANTSPDPFNSRYFQELGSIVNGLNNYQRLLKISGGQVQLTYFNNLVWNGKTLVDTEKPNKVRDFSSFEKYHDFLSYSLKRISANISAPGRKFPYQMLGTLSSGYDSTTNTVLAHKVGLQEVISFTNARGGDADDGKEIADVLGIRLSLIPRSKWQSQSLAEAPFIAADAKGEDVYFAAADDVLSGRVLLTGFHGDKVWAKETYKLDATIYRGDRSGLSLTEFRLLKGFIHFPVPFMGVRQIRDINKISNSDEMKPWDIPGDYSRPICRRIVEGAGVERNLFGISKKAASVLFGSKEDSISPPLRKALIEWLQKHESVWLQKGQKSPHKQIALINRFGTSLKILRKIVRTIARISPGPVKSYFNRLSQKLDHLDNDAYLLRYSFHWAIEKLKERFSAYNRLEGECRQR